MKKKRVAEIFFFTALLIVLWQILYVAGTDWLSLFKPYALPSPIGVCRCFWNMCAAGTLPRAVGYSLLRAVTGFFLSVFAGTLLGIIILQPGFFGKNIKPMIMGLQTLPSICWVPFAILWFGLTEGAILFVIVMGSAFSIALSVENGVKNVPPIYIKAALTMGITPANLYTKVIFPAALPAFIGGLKQGWSFSWRALASGEVLSASAGLGYILILGRDLADINQVMTVMLTIIAIGILIDKCFFSSIENRILRARGQLDEIGGQKK